MYTAVGKQLYLLEQSKHLCLERNYETSCSVKIITSFCQNEDILALGIYIYSKVPVCCTCKEKEKRCKQFKKFNI